MQNDTNTTKRTDNGEDNVKIDKRQADIQRIGEMWIKHISNTVVYPQLVRILNEYIYDRNVDSEYLVFVVQYCIDNHLGLHYPKGLRYFIDNGEIQKAYQRKVLSKNRVDIYSFTANNNFENLPRCAAPKKQATFSDILK